MKRYLFLDIDEVLNSVSYRIHFYQTHGRSVCYEDEHIDKNALHWLNFIAESTQCTIVLQSTWRTRSDHHTFANPQESATFYTQFFQKLGANFIISDTTSFTHHDVDKGAFEYMQQHQIPPEHAIILDDSVCEYSPCLWISPNAFTGLQLSHVYDILAYWTPEHIFVSAYNDYLHSPKSTISPHP